MPKPVEVIIDSFATQLKEYVCKKYKLNFNKMMNDPAYKELHRDKLIKDSNDLRMEQPFIWFDALAKKYKNKNIDLVFIISSDYPRQGKDTAALALQGHSTRIISTGRNRSINVLIVPDLRYHNEIDGFKIRMLKYFKRVVHIHVTTNLETLFHRVGTHEGLYKTLKLRFDRSERELTVATCDPDYLISNNKSKEVYNDLLYAIWSYEFHQTLKMIDALPAKKIKK